MGLFEHDGALYTATELGTGEMPIVERLDTLKGRWVPVPIESAEAVSPFGTAFAAGPAEAVPPAEGDCPVISAGDDDGTGADTGIQLEEGMVLGLDNLIALRSLLPPEVWN